VHAVKFIFDTVKVFILNLLQKLIYYIGSRSANRRKAKGSFSFFVDNNDDVDVDDDDSNGSGDKGFSIASVFSSLHNIQNQVQSLPSVVYR
jgi:hypothetical protein